MVVLVLAEHPAALVTVTENESAHRLVAVAVVWLLLHL
jgi:hypothetical protein